MMPAPFTHPLTLPALMPSIPLELHIPGENRLAGPLALALLEADIITDAMLRPGPNAPLVEVLAEPDEESLAELALSTWWNDLRTQYPLRHFRWRMHVQELDDVHIDKRHGKGPFGWFCITRIDNEDMPRFTLSRRITDLERTLEGLGQTVMAVLFDTVRLLPDALDPWRAHDWASWIHWDDSSTDEELIENFRLENDYKTTQEAQDNFGGVTRADFYADMPEWVVLPKRMVSRKDAVKSANEQWQLDVIEACDALSTAVSQPSFSLKPWDVGSAPCGIDSVDGCMVLLWKQYDPVGQVIDDAMNMFGQSGQYCEFIDARPVGLNSKDVCQYMRRTERVMQIAALAERLIDLVGDPI